MKKREEAKIGKRRRDEARKIARYFTVEGEKRREMARRGEARREMARRGKKRREHAEKARRGENTEISPTTANSGMNRFLPGG